MATTKKTETPPVLSPSAKRCAFRDGWIDAANRREPVGYAATQIDRKHPYDEYLDGYNAGRTMFKIALDSYFVE